MSAQFFRYEIPGATTIKDVEIYIGREWDCTILHIAFSPEEVLYKSIEKGYPDSTLYYNINDRVFLAVI